MKSISRFFRRPADTTGLIDVKQLIRELTDAELLESADAYFSSLTVESEQCYKPFSNAGDAVHITRHLGLLLQAAELFRGADVLDFGCATGWLTSALADLGTKAVGVDISPSAVALAEKVRERRIARAGGSVRFLAYAGGRLPLADESMDRVICFDAFHHVRDQAHVLGEFARVLRPGGRLAMMEPGPNHSRTAQSQAEMARFKVIENDVVMAEICEAATRVGFSPPQMLVQFQVPLTVPLETFEQWAAPAELPLHEERHLLSALRGGLTDGQCFFMTKGAAPPDSRQPQALGAQISLLSAQPVQPGTDVFELRFRIHNTGEAIWLAEPDRPGQVNLGSQLFAPDGTVRNLDHGRFPLTVETVQPGATFDLVVQVQRPAAGDYLRFDLVSELVAWFEQAGRCQPLEWRPPA